jgi:TPR repeat protein
MANWFYNIFTVSGEKDELKQFKINAMGLSDFYDDGPTTVFSFQSLMPMPLDVSNDPEKRKKWIDENWGMTGVAGARLEEETESELVYFFETRNDAPITFLKNLAKLWPKLKFRDSFVEPINLRYALFIEVQGDKSTPFGLTCPEHAVPVLREEAEMGHTPSQYNLGVCYARGEGVKQDIDEAKRWWTLAAAKGDEDAQRALAKENA